MYDPTFPESQITPKMSPTQIRTNFSVFGTAEAINHVAMNTVGLDQGKHTNVIFKQQTVDPSVTNNYGTLYCKNAIQASGNALNLFYRVIQCIPNVPNVPQQMTFNIVTLTGFSGGMAPAPVYTNSQQSFIFGGFIVYFGYAKAGTVTGGFGFNVAPGGGIPIASRLVSGRVISDDGSFPFSFNGMNVILFGNAVSHATPLNYFIIGLV